MCQSLLTPQRIAVRRAKRRAVGGRWRQHVTVGVTHSGWLLGLGDFDGYYLISYVVLVRSLSFLVRVKYGDITLRMAIPPV
jgi:hypothetical protein